MTIQANLAEVLLKSVAAGSAIYVLRKGKLWRDQSLWA